MLQVRNLCAGYDKHEVIHDATFSVGRGEFVCMLGANGCGKTTILKNVLGFAKPFSGSIKMDGDSVLRMRERELARRVAYIPQAHTPPFPFTVADVVIMGRTPYINRLAVVSEEDKAIAVCALRRLSIEHLASRTYTQLSGGQRQLVIIARALAQKPDLLVMDEPTASLDFGNQHIVMAQMRKLADAGMGVLMVTHDPDHALLCADRVIVVQDGVITHDGTPADVIDNECMQAIYGTSVLVAEVSRAQGRSVRVCVPLM
ncbi:MAG: ABC transporter ATP-binding protein [Coriobacteriia bacterium]|nr:ABC transporter ATP-binding protein [Coriobacteriia bacterium]